MTVRRIQTETPARPVAAAISADARGALDAARAEGLPVIAQCPFIKDFIERHPDYQDLLA